MGALDAMANFGVGAMVQTRDRFGRPISGGGMVPRSSLSNAAAIRANNVASIVRPDIPGVPERDAAILPSGFPVFSFALATGTGILTQTMNVQTPFRGQRLVAQVIRNGASAALTAPIIQFLQIGFKPIVTTANPVPLELFAANAYETNLLMPPTIPGVIYTLSMSLPVALTTTDTILAFVGIIGSAVL